MTRHCWIKKTSIALVNLTVALTYLARPAKAGLGQPEITAASAVLMEWSTGSVLYEKNAFVRRHPASLTKIMTAVVALEKGYLGDVVRVSPQAAWEAGSYMGLSPGDLYTLEDLLYGAMLPSGNDACVAIAEHLGGGDVKKFVNMMNQKARELGAWDTWFCNPHGLTEDEHLTTAYDLALITRYAMGIPLFAKIVSTGEHDAWRLQDMRVNPLYSTNKMLWSYPGAEGVKTGTTSAAGLCLVAAASKEGVRYIAVILDSYDRWGDAKRLLSYAQENFTLIPNPYTHKAVGSVKVVGGREKVVEGYITGPTGWVLPKDQALTVRLIMAERVSAPISKGEQLGHLAVVTESEVVDDVPIVAMKDVGQSSFGGLLVDAAVFLFRTMARAKLG
ncbi:MAG TPA: D-alanyl-D-alanine carboxypeptidase [Firmicutes bacterium]|nr:D-alanyl-D-alanine carboxypeptidase [Bacillota bacterium]